MLPDDAVRLQHMRDAILLVETFIENRSRADIDTDPQLQFALARAIEIVGEAAARLSQELRADCPNIPWAAMIGMRNRLAHAYFDLDNNVLWTTATVSLPELAEKLAPLFGK